MYVVDPSVRDHIPEGVRVDMPDVINALLAKGKRVNAYGFCEEWYDIGTPTTYRNAEREFLANPDRYISRSPRIEPTGLDRVSAEVPPLPTGTDGRAQLSISTVR
jgi:NDP-sugar pyrophosphorylase family protein